jgi:hypothetical protein
MPHLPHLGNLRQHARFSDWRTSHRVPVPLFSGAPLEFLVTVDLTGADYPPDVADAVDAFFSLGDQDRLAASDRVYAYYCEIRKLAERRKMMDLLHIEPRTLDDAQAIWKFVTPTGISVDRDDGGGDVYVTVACGCTWEPEHGLQMVYQRGARLVRVSGQDGHLTDA